MNYLRRPPRSRTRDRIAAMRRLVEKLAIGEMPGDEISRSLKLSPSCCRKYLVDLIDGGIVDLARREPRSKLGRLGQPVYKLVASQQKIERFFEDALVVKPDSEPKVDLRTMLAGAGRHFHILADDTQYAIRVSCAPAMRDPLVAAFFGPAREVMA